MLYDVYYPHSRDLDRAVPWDYLRRIADAGEPRNVGAKAVCIDGPKDTLVLTQHGNTLSWDRR